MDETLLDIEMETVSIEFDENVIEQLDAKAFTDHRNNRQAAIRDLLDEWLKTHNE